MSRLTIEVLKDLESTNVPTRVLAAKEFGEMDMLALSDISTITERLLIEDEPEVLIEIIYALAKIGDQRTVKAIQYWDHDTNKSVRAAVAAALVILNLPDMTEFDLMNKWNDPNLEESVRIALFNLLIKKGRTEIFISAINHESLVVRQSAIKVAADSQLASVAPAIMERIAVEVDSSLRQAMFSCLQTIAPDESAAFEEAFSLGRLRDSNWETRVEAVRDIGRNLDQTKAKILLTYLKDENDSDVTDAMKQVFDSHPEIFSVEDWLGYLDVDDQSVQLIAVTAVREILEKDPSKVTIAILVKLLNYEEDWETREFAAKQMEMVKGEEAKIALLARVEVEDDEDVIQAIEDSLEGYGDVLDLLLKKLNNDEDYGIRQTAAEKLASKDDPRIAPALLDRLDEEDNEDAQDAIADALDQQDTSSVSTDRLIELLESDNWKCRETVVKLLGKRDDPNVTTALVDRLDEEDDEDVQEAINEAIGDKGDEAVIQVNIRRLDNDDSNIRLNAAEKLANYDTPEVVTVLLDRLHEEDDADVADAIITALENKNSDSVETSRLIELLESDDWKCRETVVKLLGKRKDTVAVEALKNQLENEDDSDVQTAIEEALEEIS